MFPDAIRAAIEGSDAFVFVITPESAASAYCENEVEHALALNKRVVPVLREAVPDDGLPEAIRVRNWIPYTADVDAAAASERLVAALDTDLAYVHAHTRWLVKALEWDAKGRDKSLLLRGSELASAEAWLAGVGDEADPAPTSLQREYLLAGRTASARRQRVLVGASLTGLVLALILAGFALISRNEAQTARDEAVVARNEAVFAKANAQSRALAAQSANQLNVDNERSLLLAMEAVRTQETPEAAYALRRAIDLSPIRGRLPQVGQSFPQVAYSPDGTQLAQGYSPIDDTFTLVLFDARTLKVQRRVRVGKQPGNYTVSSHVVAYNPAGTIVAVATANGVLLVDPRTGEKLYTIKGMTNSHSLSWSPDGTLLAGSQEAADRSIGHGMLWDLRTRKLRIIPTGSVGIRDGQAKSIRRVSFAPDGRTVALGGGGGVGIFDLEANRIVAKALPRALNNRALEHSPDGKLILLSIIPHDTDPDPRVRLELRDARTLELKDTIFSTRNTGKLVGSAHFSPDGTRIVYTAGHSFAVYSLAAKRIVYETNVGAANYRSSGFSPDGRELAVSSDDGGGAVFRADGAERAVIDVGPAINTFIGVRPLALTQDRVIAAISPTDGPDKGLELVKSWSWNGKQAAAPLRLTRYNNYPWFGVDPTGGTAFTAATEDSGSWSPEKTFSRPTPMKVWDMAKRQVVKRPVTLRGFSLLPTISGDGAHLLVSVVRDPSGQQQLTLVDLASGKIKLQAKSPCLGFGEQAVSADGSLVAAISPCPGLHTWRITPTGPVANPLPADVTRESGPLAFSADAKQLAVANLGGQGEVGIVDAQSGKKLATLAGHTDRVVGVVFTPDGKRLVTSSRDGTARVWDTQSGRLLRTLDHPAPLTLAGIASSPDGRTTSTLDEDGVIRLWDTCTDCENTAALMALAKTRVTRELTPTERATYLG